MYENRNASRNDLDAARAASGSADAQVAAAEKQLELARRQLSYTKLTAPVAGAIATVDIEPNENTQAGQTIAQLTAGSKLEVEVAMPEILISNVREGDPVVVTFDALPGITRNARITEVGVASMGIATAFPVTVLVDDVHE
ncbi:MAG: efflux RND transporter periplasmic adaptor subunit, partial [bacterium]